MLEEAAKTLETGLPFVQRMEAAILAYVGAAEEWGHFHYLTGRASSEAIDAAWNRLNAANSELCAVAAHIQKADRPVCPDHKAR